LNPGTPSAKGKSGAATSTGGSTPGMPTITPSNSGISNFGGAANAASGSPDGTGN
jgi:hypothetical protein